MRFASCHPDRKHHAKGMCKQCYNDAAPKRNSQAHMEQRAANSLKWKSKNTDKVRNSRYVKKYGITLLEVSAMKEVQEGCCAICKKPTYDLHVDHHHDTNTVRGLLCGTCNRGIGNLRECTDILLSAIKYLLYWSTRYKEKSNV